MLKKKNSTATNAELRSAGIISTGMMECVMTAFFEGYFPEDAQVLEIRRD